MSYPIINPNATVPNPAANPTGNAPDLPGVFAPASPGSWIYDFDPRHLVARATFNGEVVGDFPPGPEGPPFGINYVRPGGDNYTVLLDDDIIYLTPATPFTLTLPNSSDRTGRRLRVQVWFSTGGSLVVSSPLAQLNILGSAGWLGATTTTYTTDTQAYGDGLIIDLFPLSGNWYLVNAGPAIFGNAPPNPGPFALPGVPRTTGVINAALMADLKWRVPGTNFRNVAGNVTVTPTDDVLFFSHIAAAQTLTLPGVSSVPSGKTFRVVIYRITATGSLAITPVGTTDALLFQSTTDGWAGIDATTPYVIPYPGTPNAGIELLFIAVGATTWYMLNQGPPIIGSPVIPGLMPAPPAGTVSNAVLQADMTWRVPGTNYVSVGNQDYVANATDNVIYFWGANAPYTLTLPPAAPAGKIVHLVLTLGHAAGSLTIRPAAGESLTIINNPLAGNATNGYTIVYPGTANTYHITFVSAGWGYFAINHGPPLTGSGPSLNENISGLMPAVPVGTPATAVLHADMTWY